MRKSLLSAALVIVCLPFFTSEASARKGCYDREEGCAEVQISVPQSVIPGKGTPACDEQRAKSASAVLDALGGLADSYIGYPITTAALSYQPVKNRVLTALGLHYGPSICQVMCVVAPADQRWSWIVYASDDYSSADLTSQDKEFGIGWAKLDWVSYTTDGSKDLVCASVRNWSHDRERRFRLRVEW